MRVAIIGAGPAGMTAALELARGGAQVSVYEASQHVGGMSRSFDLWGQRVDLGPHRFFSSDRRVNQLWLDVVGDDYAMIDRLTRIYYQGRFFPYPLKPFATLRNLGLVDAAACLTSYLKEQLSPSFSAADPATFESWVVLRFGRRLFETFFKSYTEKLWGIPCDQISPDFAAQRIKAFSLREALLSALSPQRGKRHETLLDRFAYPLMGTGAIYEKMAVQVTQLGGEIQLGSPVKRILHDGYDTRGVQLQAGDEVLFDHVVSTMPLSLLVRGVANVPAEVSAAVDQLQFRNTILVYLQVDSDSLFDDQWLYIHDPSLKIGRVTNFRNWTPQLYGQQQATILAAELWCNDDDADWQATDESLIDLATSEIRSTGLLKNEAVAAGRVIRVRRCYPVYRRGYRRHLKVIVDFLRNFRGLTPIGRYGSFKYVNQDNSILMGILAAENILNDSDHDLWNLHADDNRYQETALISETGLGARREGVKAS